jgi:1,4-dihydroxy-6-naphthoate synthase
MKSISIAYSCDSDDAFMIKQLTELDNPHYQFTFVADDIEVLNQKALQGVYDVSAISMAVLPLVQNEYQLLPIGASVGRQYGPCVISKEPRPLESIKYIAVPGRYTSAFMAAQILLPSFQPVFCSFQEVENLVKQDIVDAGILIHELQIEPTGFVKIADLGHLWFERFQCPMPLGGIVIRKSLGEDTITELTAMYRESIEWALKHRKDALAYASKQAKAKLDDHKQNRYIEMYVNQDSLSISDELEQGLKILFDHMEMIRELS